MDGGPSLAGRARGAARRARDLALARPARERSRRRRFYGGLVRPGDLVFDVGANLGARSEVFLALGARVVAVEPQEECTRQLRAKWRDEPRFTLFEGACADEVGERELFVADASSLSSMSPEWIEAVRSSGRFESYHWDERRLVPTTSLDALVAEHGVPAFVKVDVEGFEVEVLAGLSRPVGCLSIEWAWEALANTARCLERLSGLGMTECNFSLGESMSWALPEWVGAEHVMERLRALPEDEDSWGDVYARPPAPAAR